MRRSIVSSEGLVIRIWWWSRSPWQRGSNENTNRLLRQYLPRGTDLSLHSGLETVQKLVCNQHRAPLPGTIDGDERSKPPARQTAALASYWGCAGARLFFRSARLHSVRTAAAG
jgi:hypothetical protein